MNARTARATIRHRATMATGVFHFDADGVFTRFETEDRYQGTGISAPLVRWSAEVAAVRFNVGALSSGRPA